MAHVLIYCTNEEESHRAVAGLLVKNTLVHGGPYHSEAPEAMAYLKATILRGLADDVAMIRQTAGAVISSLLAFEEAGGWPEALDAITKGLNSADNNVAEVCCECTMCLGLTDGRGVSRR